MEELQVLSFTKLRLISVAIFIFVLATALSTVNGSSSPCSSNGKGPVTPTIPLVSFLERVQEAALSTFGESQFDPKLYVDLPLKFDLSTTVNAFDKLPRSGNGSVTVADLKGFIGKYFEGAGDDMVYAEPVDFVPEPEGFLMKVKNPEVRAWALEVHALWKNLSRKVSDKVLKQPELHTLLPLPEPVMIPGSRYKEVYYWDSYWVIRGLLASKMYKTAKAIVTNLIHLIEEYGHVLNGARAYYTNRSQPPLLSAMVHQIYSRTGDTQLVKKALPALDKQSALKISSTSEKQKFYREVASTAECWLGLQHKVDEMELDIAALAKVTGDKSTAEHFLKASQDRVMAIKSIFWNSNKGQWLDYWLSDSTCQVVSLCKSLWCLTVNSPSAVLLIVRFDSFRNLKLGKLQKNGSKDGEIHGAECGTFKLNGPGNYKRKSIR
ncbi:Trehalase [Morella rubra]|uniref:alpha,alpha-trehalase n=1 Tax=Morella rubra TaxID=262757 RepID=A0A6A1VTZ2_9ROSI|nr:Trehalase [Morella rubra]